MNFNIKRAPFSFERKINLKKKLPKSFNNDSNWEYLVIIACFKLPYMCMVTESTYVPVYSYRYT